MINERNMIQAKDAFFKLLVNAKANNIFGNPGTTEFPFMDALPNHPEINYKLAIHDSVAVGMAMGYSQVTNQASVVNLHATPGLTNALGNVYNAHKSKVPMLVTAGQVDTHIQLAEPPLWGPMVDIAKPITKWSYEVKHPEELIPATRRALQIALTPPYGPVFLALPADVLDGYIEIPDLSFTIPTVSYDISEKSYQSILGMLQKAEKPLLVVGDGLAASPYVNEAVKFAKTFGVKVFEERIAPTVAFPTGHPQFFGSIGFDGKSIANTFNTHDLVIVAGASRIVSIVPDPDLKIREDIPVIQIDSDEWELGKVLNPQIMLKADPGEVLMNLSRMGEGAERTEIDNRIAKIQEDQQARQQKLSEKVENEKSQSPLMVSEVVTTLRKYLDDNDIIFDESLTSTPAIKQHASLNPGQYYGIKGTCLGWGLPAALGAKISRDDDTNVVSFIGDGAMMYAPQTLWSAAYFDIPLTVVVVNNRSYKILKEGMKFYREGVEKPYDFLDLENPHIDYAGLANSLGVESRVVKTSDELDETFKYAFTRKNNAPLLIEVFIDRTVN